MAEAKTRQTAASVKGFIGSIKDKKRQADAQTVLGIMQAVTGEEPAMWGTSIVGFGSYHYVYDSGREGDSCLVGFSPRAQALVLYLMGDFPEREELIAKLGKCKTGKGCIYVRSMEDIHVPTLRRFIRKSFVYVKKRYPAA
jgi:hypothetical protein